jgi:putative endopeptidase
VTTEIKPIDPSLFDTSTPPAEDFYRHVNGGWLDTNPIPPEFPAWGAFFEVHVRNEQLLHRLLEVAADEEASEGSAMQMVGDYFAAGIDEDAVESAGVEPLRPLLDRVDALTTRDELPTIVHELQRNGVAAFHGLSVNPDFQNADRYLVFLGQGGLGLPERDYYLRDDERSVAIRQAYAAHVAAQLANLDPARGDTAEAAAAVMALEHRLAESSLPADQLRDVQKTLNRHMVDDLDDLMPGFGLEAYARALGVTTDSVNVDHAPFFRTFDQALVDTPVEVLADYLRWHVVRSYASALSRTFDDEAFQFYGRTLGGQQEQRERWKRVLSAASQDIGDQVARLYVEEAFSPEAKARAEQMVDHLLEAMERSLRQLDWMTDGTREAALEKLANFTYKIGYPDEWRDYAGLEIDQGSYAGNRMRAAAFEVDRQLGRLEEPVDKGEWEMPAHSVNAYYHPMLNEIVFPAGILQAPMYYPDADDPVNYGAIGTVIGHEITHGFDDQGSRFDPEGRLLNWWSDEDRTEFDERARRLAKQFDAYEVAPGQHVNGQLTIGENIADLGGLAIAFDAMRSALTDEEAPIDGFTPIQRFFLSYATIWRMNYTDEYLNLLANVDVHAPNPLRVNGPLSNFPAFAEAFAVEEGPMARSDDDLVKIW